MASKNTILLDLDSVAPNTYQGGQPTLVDGVMPFLEWARQTYTNMGLVTPRSQAEIDYLSNMHGVGDKFDVIVIRDAMPNGENKPFPDIYLVTLAWLGAQGCNTVVIENSSDGILAANAAGCMALAIATVCPVSELWAGGPTYAVDSYAEARTALELHQNSIPAAVSA